MHQQTWLPTQSEVDASRKWHYLDASTKPLGRLATQIAILLAGKHKKIYTPHMDCGDFVVITNASNVKLTGNKPGQKFYFRHSGYVDGAKVIPFQRQLAKDPTQIVYLAVRRMLDGNKLRARRMKRLKIFAGEQTQFAVAKTAKAKQQA